MDTQGMSMPSGNYEGKAREYKSISIKKTRMIEDIMREEIKVIINEVLDERQRRYEIEDDSWLYRGTY